MLFLTATTLTFGPSKTKRSLRSTISTTVFHKCVGRYCKWTLCFTKQTKRGTAPRVFKQCVGRAADVEVLQGERVHMWYLQHHILLGQ